MSLTIVQGWTAVKEDEKDFVLHSGQTAKLTLLPAPLAQRGSELYSGELETIAQYRQLVADKGNPAVSRSGTKLLFLEFESKYGNGFLIVTTPPPSAGKQRRTIAGSILGEHLVAINGWFEPGSDDKYVKEVIAILRTLKPLRATSGSD